MSDPVDALPPEIREAARLLLRRVAAAGQRKNPGDRAGQDAQKDLSALLQNAGIYKTDPRYLAAMAPGRQLYAGKVTVAATPQRPAVTTDTRLVVEWMATPDFRKLVAMCQRGAIE